MRIWRLEHSEWIYDQTNHYTGPYCGIMSSEHKYRGYGVPYGSWDSSLCGTDCVHMLVDQALEEIVEFSSDRPLPTMDGIRHDRYDESDKAYICGFSDERALTTWFPSEVLSELYGYGYVVRVYEVPMRYVRVGQYQLMFHCEEAKELHTYLP